MDQTTRGRGVPASRHTTSRSTTGEIEGFIGQAHRLGPAAAACKGRLIFALDATMSRQPTWMVAAEIQAGMFDAASEVGGLSVQLVYFRGLDECRASRWVAEPARLHDLMAGVSVRGGRTQIGRVLAHVRTEALRAKVDALVYIGDAMEESIDELCGIAGELGLLGTKAFMFHEGGNPVAASAFGEIARLSNGAALPFDSRAPAALASLLRAIAAYAAGGLPELERLSAGDPSARRLLAAFR